VSTAIAAFIFQEFGDDRCSDEHLARQSLELLNLW